MQNATATVVLALGGKNLSATLNFHETRKLAAAISELTEAGQVRVIVDWDQVEWINPLAIGILLARRHALVNAGGELKFSRMRPEVRTVFSNFRVAEFFESYTTLEDAIESFHEEWQQEGVRHEA